MDRRIGSTRRMSDQHAWIVNAQITIALHDSRGRKFGPNELAGILRHEIGHALGLPHTAEFADIMYFFGYGGDIPAFFNRYRTRLKNRGDIATTSGLSPADIARVRTLYPAR
jgi:hypothetical protein